MDKFYDKLEKNYFQVGCITLGLISLKQLRGICLDNDKLDENVFDKNVRGFLNMNSKPNKDILKTANENNEEFHIYNNGLTILYDGKSPKIINGLQTTKVLMNPKNKAEKLFIQVKVVDTSNAGFTKKHIRDLILSSNSSNSITHWDLMAHDEQSIIVENKLKQWNYKYIRLRDKKSDTSMDSYKNEIQPTFFSKVMFSMYENPGEAKTTLGKFGIPGSFKRLVTYHRVKMLKNNEWENINKSLSFALEYSSKHKNKINLNHKGETISRDFNPAIFMTHAVTIYSAALKQNKELSVTEVTDVIKNHLINVFIKLKRTDFTTLSTTAWFGQIFRTKGNVIYDIDELSEAHSTARKESVIKYTEKFKENAPK